jgi:hypothetical protein
MSILYSITFFLFAGHLGHSIVGKLFCKLYQKKTIFTKRKKIEIGSFYQRKSTPLKTGRISSAGPDFIPEKA